MDTFENLHISEMPLSSPYFRAKVECFLGENGLRMEDLDVYCAFEDEDGNILAGAGISQDIIKCIAVASKARQEGLVAPLVSHLISLASARGIQELKLFTKPENQAVFESLGFRVLASAPKAILMENGRGLERYCAYLRGFAREGRNGVVVMNANPFTLGHLYLLEQAAKQVDTLFVIPVAEEGQRFPYADRFAMIQAACRLSEENYFLCGCSKNQFPSDRNPSQSLAKNIFLPSKVVLLEGSAYQISAATFPTYFLKDLSDAAETQMRLDLDLFARHIVPALNASVRFVGSEPLDALTNHYNTLMREILPIEVVEIPRLKFVSVCPTSEENYFSCGCLKNQFSSDDTNPAHADAISATSVRKYLDEGDFAAASALCPESTWPYLLADLARHALQLELDLPLKPGLVCPDSSGAHKDMDYATMQKGIAAIRPFFAPMALADTPETLRKLGIEAEKAMLAATGGVNTHRGAIFCLGLALNAWTQGAYNEELMQLTLGNLAGGINTINQRVNDLPPRSAMVNALGGYKDLFENWLPYLRSLPKGETALQKLLLRIMSTLDDTCVIKRVGYERAQQVKQEAKEMADQVGHEDTAGYLQALCDRYAAEGISPGGAADMLALTIFIDSII
jgi:cytidyltransferase-like protein